MSMKKQPKGKQMTTTAVLLKCPKTGADVPTGFTVSPEANGTIKNVRFTCPACGEDHLWEKAQGSYRASLVR
jgi:hypothetical protein